MNCQSLFSRKIRKISSIYHLLNLPIAWLALNSLLAFLSLQKSTVTVSQIEQSQT